MKPMFSIPLSDRPLFASAILSNNSSSKQKLPPQLIVGGADHGLAQISLGTNTVTAKLYSKNYGHQEWVACVEPLTSSGGKHKVCSGGMDAKVCIWTLVTPPKTSQHFHSDTRPKLPEATCVDLIGHEASVSCLRASGNQKILASGSYDATVKIWDVTNTRRGGLCVATLCQESSIGSTQNYNTGLDNSLNLSSLSLLASSKRSQSVPTVDKFRKRRPTPSNAILGFINTDPTNPTSSSLSSYASPSRVITYTRNGVIYCHDLNSSPQRTTSARNQPTKIHPTSSIQAHHGPISSLLLLASNPGGDVVVSSGLLDGAVRCFDFRVPEGQGRCVGRYEGIYCGSSDGKDSGTETGGGGVTMMVGVGGGVNPCAGDCLSVVTAGGGGDGVLKVLEIKGGGKMRKLKGLDIVEEIAPTLWTCSSADGEDKVSKLSKKPSRTNVASPTSASLAVYQMTSVSQIGGIAVAWGDGRTQLISNLTKSSQLEYGQREPASNSTGTTINNMETRESGIKNAIRTFSVFDIEERNKTMGIACAGDDGIVLAYEIPY